MTSLEELKSVTPIETPLYNAAEKFVFDAFTKIDKSEQLKHFSRTVDWMKILSPEADEALLVAAISHDIERAFRQKDMSEKRGLGWTNTEFFRPHEERGAEIIANFLKEQGVDDKFIEKVKNLVARHEEGGDDDQNLLKDADSISFLENNIAFFFLPKSLEMGKEKIQQKFDWMFNRITSPKAKQIAQPFYDRAIKELNEAFNN